VTARVTAEVVVADNGSSDATAPLLRRWCAEAPTHVVVRVDEPGKSRALNQALHHARAPLLAFVDDDETVASAWLQGILALCADHPEYHAAIGRVLPPPEVTDAEILTRLACYRTIAFFDGGDVVHDVHTLYGGNMVVRRSAFEAA